MNVEQEVGRKNQEIDELRLKVTQLESLPPSARSEPDPQLTYRVNELTEEVSAQITENAILKAQVQWNPVRVYAPFTVKFGHVLYISGYAI